MKTSFGRWNRRPITGWICTAAIGYLVAGAVDFALAESPAGRETAEESNALSVPAWVEKLDSDSFAQREAASRRLRQYGPQAIDVLAQAAQRGSYEVGCRVLDILIGYHQSADTATRNRAEAALKRLASSDAPVARRAANRLNPPQDRIAAVPRAVPRQLGGRIQVAPAQGRGAIQIRIAGGNQGLRKIDVRENGRRVQIEEDPQQGIELKVTQQQQPGGQPKVDTYRAADKQELKKKHPQAYKIYEKYSARGAVPQLRIARPQVPPNVPGGNPQPAVQRINQANERMAEILQKLKRLQSAGGEAKQQAELQRELNQAKRDLIESLEELKSARGKQSR